MEERDEEPFSNPILNGAGSPPRNSSSPRPRVMNLLTFSQMSMSNFKNFMNEKESNGSETIIVE